MRRYVVTFALAGFVACMVMGFVSDREFATLLALSALWGGIFALLGAGVGWAIRSLLVELDVEGSERKALDEQAASEPDFFDRMARALGEDPELLRSAAVDEVIDEHDKSEPGVKWAGSEPESKPKEHAQGATVASSS